MVWGRQSLSCFLVRMSCRTPRDSSDPKAAPSGGDSAHELFLEHATAPNCGGIVPLAATRAAACRPGPLPRPSHPIRRRQRVPQGLRRYPRATAASGAASAATRRSSPRPGTGSMRPSCPTTPWAISPRASSTTGGSRLTLPEEWQCPICPGRIQILDMCQATGYLCATAKQGCQPRVSRGLVFLCAAALER